MLGPSGPRRLRLAVEHLAQHRGGICFCIDLDPRWVIKLIKKGWMEHLEAYKQHCIDQAITILTAGHDIRCMFTTPKLLESLALELEKRGTQRFAERASRASFPAAPSSRRSGPASPPRSFSDGVYMTPTYGNTLMGLACSEAGHGGRRLQDHLLRAAAAGRDRGGRFQRLRPRGRLRPDRPREADHA